jgi:hypothetical protein
MKKKRTSLFPHGKIISVRFLLFLKEVNLGYEEKSCEKEEGY